ncbi:MAG TPA: methyltransferase domain-containing protein [Steroidobacteraceae bacterium]
MSRPDAPSGARESAARRPVTGAEYVRQLSARKSDRRTREAFQRVALGLAPPGGRLFDFGAGTGTDARLYAEHGLTVTAYDVDPEMRAFFAEYCRDFMASGQVSLQGGTYREFLVRPAASPGPADRANPAGADLVTANFAPLNLVEDLPELFAKFHALTAPGGRVLASVLSPYFIGDLRYRWWWRNLPRLWRAGHYAVHGHHGPIIRRRLASCAAQALPYFTLQRVFPALSRMTKHGGAGFDPRRLGIDVRDGPGSAWCHAVGGLYMFLLYEKSN